ncbi:hypothetical protein D3C74_395150 [compost metagenome]
MNGGGSSLQPDSKTRPLPDQLRFVQRHFSKRWCGYTVAGCFYHFERFGEAVVFTFGMGEILHQLQQMILAADFNTHNLHQNLVIELFRRIQIDLCHTLAHIHAAEACSFNEVVFRELGHQPVDITQTPDILHRVTD